MCLQVCSRCADYDNSKQPYCLKRNFTLRQYMYSLQNPMTLWMRRLICVITFHIRTVYTFSHRTAYMQFTSYLRHFRLESLKRDSIRLFRPRSDAAERGSDQSLHCFAFIKGISINHGNKNNNNNQTPLLLETGRSKDLILKRPFSINWIIHLL